ncbi:hypothetical protein DFH06DRAFT_1342090 [Mycena polygramma]|nr:hypothetical protein DFH06DRAFT_1342090 [Mycena polygramma]
MSAPSSSSSVAAAFSAANGPVEILSMIFALVLAGVDPSSLLFKRLRCELALVCQWWRGVVDEMPAMWKTLRVAANSSTDDLSAFLRRAESRTFNVAFVHCGLHPSEERLSHRLPDFMARFPLVAPSSARWEEVFICSPHTPTVQAVFDLLDRNALSVLRALTVSCRNQRISHFGAQIQPVSFSSRLDVITRLQLDGVPLPWSSLPVMPLLEVIILGSAPTVAWPSSAEFFSLFHTSPSLSSVTLDGIGFSDVPTLSHQSIVLPNLRHLSLTLRAFHSQGVSLLRVVSLLCLPHLHHLELRMDNPRLYRFLATNIHWQPVSLTLGLDMSQGLLLRKLYALFPGVHHLDIREAMVNTLVTLDGSSTIEALFQDGYTIPPPPITGGVLHLLPELRTVTLWSDRWEEVAKCLENRLVWGAPKLAALRCEPVHHQAFAYARASLSYSRVLELVDAVEWLPERPGQIFPIYPGSG